MVHCKRKLCTACCVSVCIELCTHKARTLVAILWLNSEWHWLCLKERDRNRGRASCSWLQAKFRLQRNTWHNIKKKLKWSLHNLSSQRQWQLWIRTQLVALKSKVHVTSVKTLPHRSGTLSCCFSEQCCTIRLAVIPAILQWGSQNKTKIRITHCNVAHLYCLEGNYTHVHEI